MLVLKPGPGRFEFRPPLVGRVSVGHLDPSNPLKLSQRAYSVSPAGGALFSPLPHCRGGWWPWAPEGGGEPGQRAIKGRAACPTARGLFSVILMVRLSDAVGRALLTEQQREARRSEEHRTLAPQTRACSVLLLMWDVRAGPRGWPCVSLLQSLH